MPAVERIHHPRHWPIMIRRVKDANLQSRREWLLARATKKLYGRDSLWSGEEQWITIN
jgi:hypothetical protein